MDQNCLPESWKSWSLSRGDLEEERPYAGAGQYEVTVGNEKLPVNLADGPCGRRMWQISGIL